MKVNQISRISLAAALAVLVIGCSGAGGGAPGGPSAGGPSAGGPSAGAPSGGGSVGPSGGGSTGTSVADLDHVADLLSPGDFAAVGVVGAGAPTVNTNEPGAAYLVFAGASGATGGIELDVVVGDSPAGMGDVFASMAAPLLDFEARGRADLPMADDAQLRTDNVIDSGTTWAGVAVQKGRLVFLIAIPGSPDAEAQLVSLAKLVLERAAGLE